MKFRKWNGLGNDFIIIAPGEGENSNFSRLAPAWCDRHFGIGADGIVKLRRLDGGAFEMRIFNSDGSEAEMCGNATRCVGLFLKRELLPDVRRFELHTKGGIVRPEVIGDSEVRVDMGAPRFRRGDIPATGDPDAEARDLELAAGTEKFRAFALSMGNPHAVIFVDDAEKFPVREVGPLLETAPLFPRKCNIEFAQVLDRRTIRMRVWERGCGVTLACGTGSCATAVAAIETGRTEERVQLMLDGGELEIQYSPGGHVFMTGSAREVYRGEITE